jgi:hypothetical protein
MTHQPSQIFTVPLVELFDPLINPPPVGATLLVINPGGVLTKSTWYKGALAWGYLPKIPQSVKDRMSPPRTSA